MPKDKFGLSAVFIFLATVFFCLSDALGKWLIASYPLFQVTWLRNLGSLCVLALAVVVTSGPGDLKTRRPIWHVGRSLISAVMMLGIYHGLKHIPLAEFVSLTFSIPLFVALLSPWLLKEKVAKQSWFAIALGFIGVLFILRPTPNHFHIAHLTTLGASLLISLLLVSARFLSVTETRWALNFYLPVAGCILFSYPALMQWSEPATGDWLLFALLAAAQTLALGCYIEALLLARPAVIAPLDYLRLVWTIIVGYVIWQELPDPYTWVGIVIIVASGIYVVRHSYVSRTEHI